jgi:serine/threonine protein kinase
MDAARYERMATLFHDTADLPVDERRAFLQSQCGEDQSLIADVLAMLEEDERGRSLLDGGLADVARHLLDDADSSSFVRDRFGPYRIVKMLGEGGMGVVYLAEREDLGSVAAIKILRDASFSPARRERFAAEQRLLAQLNHPAIARLYDAGTLPSGTPWFVMEFVEGSSITSYCRTRGSSLAERLGLFREVCEAVQYAHRQLVIHRDLKPSNILVTTDGRVKLLDFGIAKQLEELGDSSPELTRTGLRLMTPAYAAPEQIRGERVGIDTDVYSLGVILYELLAGRLPFDLTNRAPAEAERLLLDAQPEPPSAAAQQMARAPGPSQRVPFVKPREWADLDVLCLTAMHRDSTRRYRSVDALIRDLDNFVNGAPLQARPDSAAYRVNKFVIRHWHTVATVAGLLIAVVALTAVYTVSLRNARNAAQAERDRANHQTSIATAINRFLAEDLLGRSDPFRSSSSATTLAEAVKRAAPDIDRQFRDAPEVSARLHHAIARALDNRSEFPDARQQYDRAAALFAQTGGPLSEDAITLQLQRATMEARSYEAGSLPRARSILAEQESRISKLPRVSEALAVWLASARGMVALIGNDAKEAASQFQTAYDRSARLAAFDDNTRLAFQQRLAFAHIRLGDGRTAERLFRELIVAFSQVQGPDSPSVLRVRLNLAQALMIQNKHREAIDETSAIYPAYVAKLGEDHELAMQVLTTRAQSEGSLGLWDDAIRDDLKVYELAVRKQGPLSFFALATLSDAALAQCRGGRYRDGEANAKRAFELSGKAFGARAGLTGGTAYTWASCLIGLNQLEPATRLLTEIDIKAVAQLSGSPESDWAASIGLARADIAYRRGNLEAARQLLEPVVPVFSRADAEPYQRRAADKLSAAIRSSETARR